MRMISREVVPRTMLSSTISTLLPENSSAIAFSFRRTFLRRTACPGMMNVRPTYRFFTKPSRNGTPRFCASCSAATRLVSGTGITTSTASPRSSSSFFTCFASRSPIAMRLRYTLTPSITLSGRAKYTYSKMSGVNVSGAGFVTSTRRDTARGVTMIASPGRTSSKCSKPSASPTTLSLAKQ